MPTHAKTQKMKQCKGIVTHTHKILSTMLFKLQIRGSIN